MKQRYGVVFTGGAAPNVPIQIEDRAACMIVAADSGLDTVVRHGVEPDAIVGDMDSLEDRSLLDRFPDAYIERHDRAKDFTDTEIALNFLWNRAINAVTIVGGGGGRLDHLMGVLALFERQHRPQRWITDRDEVRVVESAVEFDAEAGTVVSFFPLGEGPVRMNSEGLRWPLDPLVWHRGDVGISNECMGGRCRVSMQNGRLLMVRALPSGVELP